MTDWTERGTLPSPTGRRWGKVLARHSGALACALFLIVGLGVLDDYGVWPDEPALRGYAQRNLDAIVSGYETAWPETAWPKDRGRKVDGRKVDRKRSSYYGMAFEVPALLVERSLGLTDSRDMYLTRHLLIHLVFLLGGLSGYLLVYRLFDSRVLAVCALLVFVLHPRLYAHSFFNSKDIPFASMFMFALFLLHRAFRKETVTAFVVLGVGVGVLTNLRIMGLLLVLAVVGLRAGDWWVGTGARRHLWRTTGAFVGASVVTLYVLSPYLWGNPLRFGDALALWAYHPHMSPQRFQGQVFFPNALPLAYVSTWFTITSPPVVLLLGLVGIGGVVYGAVTRPGAMVRETRLRFGGLLVACFVGPILAVMLFRSHLSGDWRHLYFLHAPFSLLAVYGLRGVTGGCRQRRLRAGMYGLAGAGMGLIVYEMVQLHPYQDVYFNRLVDRTTPEHLRSQYSLAYWGAQYREGLEYLLARYPAGPIAVSSNRCRNVERNRSILSSTARDRIVVCPSKYDFHLTAGPGAPLRPGLYARRVYNNTILTVEKMMLSKEDAATAAYRATHQVTVATTPIIQAAFDVYYLTGDRLIYAAEPCTAAEGWVFLHLHPVQVEDLPNHRVQYGFDNLDFYWHGARGGEERCLRVVHLPQYEIAELATGQYNERGALWRETFVFPERVTGSEVGEAAVSPGSGEPE